jgi:glycosyltransferase involved in cell wall biosynthesis
MADERRPPRFSILTPAYNAAETLSRTIDSVLAQTYEDWEHIIVDDGSSDDTRSIALEYAARDGRIRVAVGPHRGVTAARLETMGLARGELFARLDADDCLLPDYLGRIDAFFAQHPDADIVSTNGYQVFADGRRVFYYTAPVFQTVSSLSIGDMLSGHLIGTSAVMTRRVYEMTGGPRPEARSEDIDLWLRAVALGAKHYHLPEPIFLYYQDARDRVSGDVPAVWASHVEIIEHLIAKGLLSAEDIAIARRAIHRYRLKLLVRWDRWGIPARRALARMVRG